MSLKSSGNASHRNGKVFLEYLREKKKERKELDLDKEQKRDKPITRHDVDVPLRIPLATESILCVYSSLNPYFW